MEHLKYKVSGVTCQHCVAKVKKALESVEGVQNVYVSKEDQHVEFDAEPVPPLESINQLLEEYGDYRLSI